MIVNKKGCKFIPSSNLMHNAGYAYGEKIAKDYIGEFKNHEEADLAAHRFLNERFKFSENEEELNLSEGFFLGFVRNVGVEYDPYYDTSFTEENMETAGYNIKD
jgi:hypothetical protein